MRFYITRANGVSHRVSHFHYERVKVADFHIFDTETMRGDEVYLSSSSHSPKYHVHTYGEHVEEGNLIL